MNSSANEQQTPTDEFRSIVDIDKPDWRQTCFIIENEDGRIRQKAFADQHAAVAEYELSVSVPTDILIQWDTARNLWLHAWYVWRFYPLAEFHAYSTVEMALRRKLGHDQAPHPPMLKLLMGEAVKMGFLRDQAFRNRRQMMGSHTDLQTKDEQRAQNFGMSTAKVGPAADPQAFCKVLAQTFPKLRNHYAHGSSSLDWRINPTFGICADLIEQLFRGTK